MEKNIRLKRITEDLNQLKRAEAMKRIPSNIKYEFLVKDGVLDDYKQQITISGRQGSVYENQKIIGILSFPNNYPIDPPNF